MSKTNTAKKSPEVIAAEKALELKEAEVKDAKETVQRLEKEWGQAYETLRLAKVQDDASKPQCRLVKRHWRSGTIDELGSVVILRKTAGGMLIVRKAGEIQDHEMKFKFHPHSGHFVAAEKTSTFTYDQRELREVPAEFMPEGKTDA